MNLTYQREKHISSEEFIQVLKASTLSERRPVAELERIADMLKYGNLIITARHNGKLVGISRSMSDFAFATYLSDLAVDINYQKMGIGKELIRLTQKEAPLTKIILLAAPAAVDYYPRIGMHRHNHCYFIDSNDNII
ncbi:MAG: GNAT family N-acetyltransferase [Bacteroidota bacterium]|nr:GNAT family N-acetyltransferase [Bacteroidota bacterium]